MFIRSWNLYAIAIPLASCAAVACSAANSGKTNGTGANDTQGDSGSGDSGVELDPDSGVVQNTPPPGCPGPTAASTTAAPVGTLLASGNSLSARGVTSDGYEIYSDDYAFQLYAVPIAGGSSQTIASLGSNFWVTVVGQVVFAWSNVTGAAVGALTVWSSAAGPHALDPASFGILGASSPDGSQVAWSFQRKSTRWLR